MYSNNNDCGAGYGGIGLLVLLIFIAMFAGNGNGGLFGGRNGGDTAAETAALVQQDNLRGQVSGISSRQEWQGQLLGGAVQGIERTRDAVAELDTKICQAVNNLTQQNNATQRQISECCCDLRHQLDTQFCQTNQNILNSQNVILNTIQQNKFEALQTENQNLKAALAVQNANCAREADTREILNRVDDLGRGAFPGGPGFPGYPGGGGAAFGTSLIAALNNLNTTQQAILAKIGTTTTTTTA